MMGGWCPFCSEGRGRVKVKVATRSDVKNFCGPISREVQRYEVETLDVGAAWWDVDAHCFHYKNLRLLSWMDVTYIFQKSSSPARTSSCFYFIKFIRGRHDMHHAEGGRKCDSSSLARNSLEKHQVLQLRWGLPRNVGTSLVFYIGHKTLENSHCVTSCGQQTDKF